MGEGILEALVDVVVLPDDLVAVADKPGVIIPNRAGIPQAFAGYGSDREILPRSVAFFDGKLCISDLHSSSVLKYRIGNE